MTVTLQNVGYVVLSKHVLQYHERANTAVQCGKITLK